MCHYKAPHGLWKYAKRYEHMFDGIDIPEPASLWEDKSHRSAGSREYGRNILTLSDRMNRTTRGKEWPTGRLDTTGMSDREKVQKAYQKYMKDYLRVAAAVDENVGRVLDWLDEEGLVDNTIVIYTSDQGMFLGEQMPILPKRFSTGPALPFRLTCRGVASGAILRAERLRIGGRRCTTVTGCRWKTRMYRRTTG
jgi:arylsulfatase A-like enzyme